jgi:lipid-A-disaccharide synthase-like uncharacterized protein
MHEVLFEGNIFGQDLVITWWKIVGYLGVFLFAGRWIVQVVASGRKGRTHMPDLFWYMSICGSLMLLAYFTFGKNDSVGILSNLMPSAIAIYNLFLNIRYRARNPELVDGESGGRD